ncbi:MAG: PstS family phosphate ABC transporter substrate-binding protein [Anaerolineaceae bacterium]
MIYRKIFSLGSILVLMAVLLSACSTGNTTSPTVETPTEAATSAENGGNPVVDMTPTIASSGDITPGLAELSGDVVIDGSSTVYPITTAVAEEFTKVAPNVRISVGLSGTGGGFKKFCPGETDISDASRPIKDSEIEICKENNVEYVEFTVAMDGLTIMVNPENDWLKSVSIEQIALLLGASSTITKWSDLDPSYPDEEILFFIPDPDSGTRDYMIEIVKGSSGDEDLRQDDNTTFSSDDNVLLDGIENEKYAFGFFGYAYYVGAQDKVRAVAVVDEAGVAVLPSDQTVQDGSYNPLSRPLFIYVNKTSLLEKPQVAAFVKFFFSDQGGSKIMSDVGYSMPPTGTYESNLDLLASSIQ